MRFFNNALFNYKNNFYKKMYYRGSYFIPTWEEVTAFLIAEKTL